MGASRHARTLGAEDSQPRERAVHLPDTDYRLNVSYAALPWLQVDAGYWNSPRQEGSQSTGTLDERFYRVDFSGYTLGLRLPFELGPVILAPRVGAIRWKDDSFSLVAASRQSVLFREWDEDTTVYYGVDVAYPISEQWQASSRGSSLKCRTGQTPSIFVTVLWVGGSSFASEVKPDLGFTRS